MDLIEIVTKLQSQWNKGLLTERELAEELIVASAETLKKYTAKLEDMEEGV